MLCDISLMLVSFRRSSARKQKVTFLNTVKTVEITCDTKCSRLICFQRRRKQDGENTTQHIVMCSKVYAIVRRPSVCPSCLSRSPAARRCCRFAAVGPAGRRYRLIAAAAELHSSTAHSSTGCVGECGQCHVLSWPEKLNTDVFPRQSCNGWDVWHCLQ